LAAAIRAHRTWLRSVGEGFSAAETTLAVDGAERSGEVVTLDATETTMLSYVKIRGDEPPATGYTARHTFVFRQDTSGRWQLVEDRQLEPTDLLPLPKAETFVHGATAKVEVASPRIAPPVAGPTAGTPAATSRPVVEGARTDSDIVALAYNFGAMAAYLDR
jgi:hypothetical protein